MTPTKYSKPTIYLHWFSAIAIAVAWVIGKLMGDLDNSDAKLLLIGIHIALGTFVFIFTALRIFYTFKNPRPEMIQTGSAFHNFLIPFIYYLMIVIIIMITISGTITLFSKSLGPAILSGNYLLLPPIGFNIYHYFHELLSNLFALLLIFHIAGITSHFLRKKENLLHRIS